MRKTKKNCFWKNIARYYFQFYESIPMPEKTVHVFKAKQFSKYYVIKEIMRSEGVNRNKSERDYLSHLFVIIKMIIMTH